MKIEFTKYNFNRSIRVMDSILKSSDNEYREIKRIPSEKSLTYKNGFYVDITVLFVDIRKSKELAKNHTRPVLAKIYRTYISEVIAVMKGNKLISDVFIEGDGVWAVFNTKNNDDVNGVFTTAVEISSLIDILNIKLKERNYSEIDVGIGMDKGESLYIKAGNYGSSVNEIVWIGKVVGEAAKLCNYGNKNILDNRIMVSKMIYSRLDKDSQLFLEWNSDRECYHGNICIAKMNHWIEENR